MTEAAPAERSQEEMQKQIAKWVETKRYIEEPELIPWYQKEMPEIKPHTRELLEQYSNIPPAEVESHLRRVREEAFKIFPYPCVGNWGFLKLNIVESPVYSEVVERLKNGEQHLDIGCCMGQDIRQLVHSGVPPENLRGADLKEEFWHIGYDLFRDKSTLNVEFIQADIFDADSGLKRLNGKLSVVHAHSFFHLFDWEGQVKAAKRVIELLKAEPGVLIFGRQGGNVEAGGTQRAVLGHSPYWHNPESWAKLWKQVGDETGTKWETQSSFGSEDEKPKPGGVFDKTWKRFLTFNVRRV